MTATKLQFGRADEGQGGYRLLELPADLLKLVEQGSSDSLCIKGNATDDAVLCTGSKTYSLRSITLSNSLLVTTPPSTSCSDSVVVRHQASEILEAVPTIPRVQRLDGMLKNSSYDEADEEQPHCGSEQLDQKRYSREEIMGSIQASDGELRAIMKDRHILSVNGEMRTLPPRYLGEILTLILNCVVANSLDLTSASVKFISDDLRIMHDVVPEVTLQILNWYGDADELQGMWCCDRDAIVKEIGIGLLRQFVHNTISRTELLAKWKQSVGDTFEHHVDVELLRGHFIAEKTAMGDESLRYFSAVSLPTDPVARFGDLFLTRPRWRQEDIIPFIEGITVDSKDRDRLLIKFTRSTKDKDGTVWLTATFK